MIKPLMADNAHKVAYLIKLNPDDKLPNLLEKLTWPAVHINTALWYAQNQGWIVEPDKDTGALGLNTPPLAENWQFGDAIDTMQDMIVYALGELAKKEADLEETYMKNWLAGYAPYDIEIALAHLVETHRLAQYELTDPKDAESTYKFYTLYENGEQMWGRKQFKEQPTGEEKPAADTTNEAPQEDATNE